MSRFFSCLRMGEQWSLTAWLFCLLHLNIKSFLLLWLSNDQQGILLLEQAERCLRLGNSVICVECYLFCMQLCWKIGFGDLSWVSGWQWLKFPFWFWSWSEQFFTYINSLSFMHVFFKLCLWSLVWDFIDVLG